MTHHQAQETIEFTAQHSVELWGHRYDKGDTLTVGLVRDWDEEEGVGEGGPWGYGGYSSRLIADLSGDPDAGHTHLCLICGKELAYGQFDCELDRDHDFANCDACQANLDNA